MNSSGRYVIPGIFLAVVLYFLFQVHHVLLPFVLAATLAYLLNPLVVFFEVHGIKRRVAVWIVFITLMSAFIGLGFGALTVFSEEASRISTTGAHTIARLTALAGQVRWIAERFPNLGQSINQGQQGSKSMDWFWAHTPTLALQVLPLLELTLLVPFLALFFMLDGLGLREAALGLVPARYVEMLLSILVEIDNSLGNYLRGICIQALCMACLAGIGFRVIGLNYSVQIACWVGISSMIPLLGPVSAALAGCLVALMQWGTVAGLVKVIVICTGIRLADDWFLQPLIMRRAVHLHPAVMIFALMAGSSIFGFWGLLFAVPAVCMLKVLGEVLWEWYRAEYGLRRDPLPLEVSHIPLI